MRARRGRSGDVERSMSRFWRNPASCATLCSLSYKMKAWLCRPVCWRRCYVRFVLEGYGTTRYLDVLPETKSKRAYGARRSEMCIGEGSFISLSRAAPLSGWREAKASPAGDALGHRRKKL